jgi:hypothetical protein
MAPWYVALFCAVCLGAVAAEFLWPDATLLGSMSLFTFLVHVELVLIAGGLGYQLGRRSTG